MDTLGMILAYLGGIVSLVCFIIVLVKMFQNGKTVLAIICIIGICVCGIGPLIAFIYGWMNSTAWNIKNVMIAWTVCIILSIVGNVMNPGQFKQIQAQIPGQQGP